MNTKPIRNITVITTILTVLLATVYGILGLPVPEWSEPIILLFVGLLAATGIAVQSGQVAQKLTWNVLVSKIASPVWWGAMVALAGFITTLDIGAGALTTVQIIKLIASCIAIIIGAVNDPNNKKALKDNIAKIKVLTDQTDAEPAIKPKAA